MAPSCLPGFPTCHRATLFSRNDSGLSSFIFSSAHLPSFLARQQQCTGSMRGRFRLSPIRSHPAVPLFVSSSFLLLLLLSPPSLATLLDAVQVQSERRDTTPTFPRRWLEAGSITDFGKSGIR